MNAPKAAQEGPYALAGYGNTMFEIQDATKQVAVLKNCDLAFAQRIVACVNACEGISTDQLDGLNFRDVLRLHALADGNVAAERDALRAEVQRLREALQRMVDGCRNVPMPAESFDAIPVDEARAVLRSGK